MTDSVATTRKIEIFGLMLECGVGSQAKALVKTREIIIIFCLMTKYMYEKCNSRTSSDGPDNDNLVGGIYSDAGVESVDTFIQLANTESQTRANTEHCSNNRHDVHEISHPTVDVIT